MTLEALKERNNLTLIFRTFSAVFKIIPLLPGATRSAALHACPWLSYCAPLALVLPTFVQSLVRVKTELVQIDVTVVDKRGRLVDGLSADDFELRVDSKLQPLSFFEEVATGSVDEENQLSAARKRDAAKSERTSASGTNRGRVIFFFVDDVHLTAEGLTRARSVLTSVASMKPTPSTSSGFFSPGFNGFLRGGYRTKARPSANGSAESNWGLMTTSPARLM
jgi:hypothetical protein